MRTLITRLDSRKVAVIFVAIAYYVFVIMRLSLHGDDASFFVYAGDRYNDPNLVPHSLWVIAGSPGYDGQFYYRLALDPFTGQQTAFGTTLDEPPRRQGRIGYPLLVWALSLGHALLVPVFMLIVNLVALCTIGWLGACYAQSQRLHALWGLVFALFAGLLLSMSRDLTESMATCLLFAGVILIQRKREWLGAGVLCLAVLTRETTALFAVAGLASGLWRHWRSRHTDQQFGARRYLFFALPIAVLGVWEALMSAYWGQFAFSGRGETFDWPGFALVALVRSIIPPVMHAYQVWLVELSFLAGFTLSVLWILRKLDDSLTFEKAAWLWYGAFALVWSGQIWIEDWAFMRALAEFMLFGTMLLLAAPSRLRVPVFGASLALWLVVARDALYR